MMKSYKVSLLVIAACAAISNTANARFLIDYQGLDKEEPITSSRLREINGTPDGYNVLVDKTQGGVVNHIGEPQPIKTYSFGTDFSLGDMAFMVMPDKWIAYVDQNVEMPGSVTWQSHDEYWTDALERIGVNYGYRYIVDWDQKLIQITSDKDFMPPEYDNPISVVDPESGRKFFIYSDDSTGGGVIIVDGKVIPIQVK